MIYLGNAFSLGMLDMQEASLEVRRISPLVVPRSGWESCVGHADTAALFSGLLGATVEMRRVSTSLAIGDTLYVGQYNGPRLPEGATSLPEGATIRWFRVEVKPLCPLCDCMCGEPARAHVASYQCAGSVDLPMRVGLA